MQERPGGRGAGRRVSRGRTLEASPAPQPRRACAPTHLAKKKLIAIRLARPPSNTQALLRPARQAEATAQGRKPQGKASEQGERFWGPRGASLPPSLPAPSLHPLAPPLAHSPRPGRRAAVRGCPPCPPSCLARRRTQSGSGRTPVHMCLGRASAGRAGAEQGGARSHTRKCRPRFGPLSTARHGRACAAVPPSRTSCTAAPPSAPCCSYPRTPHAHLALVGGQGEDAGQVVPLRAVLLLAKVAHNVVPAGWARRGGRQGMRVERRPEMLLALGSGAAGVPLPSSLLRTGRRVP